MNDDTTMTQAPAMEDTAAAASSSSDAAVAARPSAVRVRSSGGGRPALGRTPTATASAAAAARAARKAAAEAEARSEAQAARTFTEQEHRDILATVWTHGLVSPPATASDNGSSSSAAAASSGAASSLRALHVHPTTLAAAPTKPSSLVDAYALTWLWTQVISPWCFCEEALRITGARGFRLNAAFVEELRCTHQIVPPRPTDDDSAPELAVQELYIPSDAAAALSLVSPAPLVLSQWVTRLRRCMLLSQVGSDASFVAATLKPISALLCTPDNSDLLPRAQWSSQDDVQLLLDTRANGYKSLQQRESPLMQSRCDLILDAFHLHSLQQVRQTVESKDLTETRVAFAASVAPASPTFVFSIPASFSSPMWCGALVRRVFAIFTMHGLPVQSVLAAANAKLQPASSAAAAGTQSSSPAFICPACPLLDWTALFSLLSRHLGVEIPASRRREWQSSLSALLCHASLEFEVLARRSIGGLSLKDGADAVYACFGLRSVNSNSMSQLCPGLLSFDALLSFRRSCFFFHHLRTRILDASFHGFGASGTEGGEEAGEGVLEWISQFAPGINAPPADANTTAEAPTTKTVGSLLQAVQAEGDDFASFLDDSPSLFSLESVAASATPSATVDVGAAASSSSSTSSTSVQSMPSWWQIGFHDLCLLKAVSTWGCELNDAFIQRLNEDFNRPVTKQGTMNDEASAATSTAADAPLSSLHWNDSTTWIAHSRPIIRQRMGELATAEASASTEGAQSPPFPPSPSLPTLTPLNFRQHGRSIIHRVGQLVTSLAAVSTDELCNRMLQFVQLNSNGTEAASASASSAAASSSASSSLPFCLSPAAAASLNYFQHSLCGYAIQGVVSGEGDIYSLFCTRYKDLIPAPSASVAAATSKAASSVAKKRRIGLHSSPGVALAAARALGLVSASPAEGDAPENPLKLSDAAFLRPTHACLVAPALATAFPHGVTRHAFGGVVQPAAGATKKKKRDHASVEADDSEDDEEDAPHSQFAQWIDADRKRARFSSRITALLGSSDLPSQLAPILPSVFVTHDGRLAMPQQFASDGFVLVVLGALHPQHVVHSQRLIAARSAARAMKSEGSQAELDSEQIILFPAGYTSVVRHVSYKRADRLVYYLCEILQPQDSNSADLIFRVTAEDDLTNPIVGSSAQSVWDSVGASIAQLYSASSSSIIAIDGVERFGLDRPGVLHAIAAELCSNLPMQRALGSAFTPKQIAHHMHSIPACQFYVCDPASSSIESSDAPAAIDRALDVEWRHNWLRLQYLKQSILNPLGSSVVVSSAASSSSNSTSQAQQQQQQQLSVELMHAQQQQQHQHQLMVAQQQAHRQRMEEEMAASQAQAAAAAAAAHVSYFTMHQQHYLAQQAQAHAAAQAGYSVQMQ